MARFRSSMKCSAEGLGLVRASMDLFSFLVAARRSIALSIMTS